MGKVRINSAKLQAQLQAKSDLAAQRGAEAFRQKLREEIAASGRVRTGAMAERIEVVPAVPEAQKGRRTVRILAPYFRFQDQGTTGSEAPKGKVLRFKPKGSGVFIFRKRTGPITPALYLEKTKARMTPRDFTGPSR